MAVPKRKKTKSRTGHQRSNWARQHSGIPNLTHCKNCEAPCRSHRVCGSCGFYDGKVVVEQPAEAAAE